MALFARLVSLCREEPLLCSALARSLTHSFHIYIIYIKYKTTSQQFDSWRSSRARPSRIQSNSWAEKSCSVENVLRSRRVRAFSRFSRLTMPRVVDFIRFFSNFLVGIVKLDYQFSLFIVCLQIKSNLSLFQETSEVIFQILTFQFTRKIDQARWYQILQITVNGSQNLYVCELHWLWHNQYWVKKIATTCKL